MISLRISNKSKGGLFVIAISMSLSACSEPAVSNSEIDASSPVQDCTPGYSLCLSPMSDYDCKGGQGDGPGYTGPVQVLGVDVYKLDRDRDGFACK